MGKGKHNANTYNNYRQQQTTSFAYSNHVKANAGVAQAHQSLHPAYGRRDCFYVNGVPSEPITVAFDVTGSNIDDARRAHADLPQLLELISIQGWVPNHPMLQWMAIGDTYSDDVPLQVSQFEQEGVKADMWLNNLFLEGNGGGNGFESYNLAMWAAVNHNHLEAWDNGKKGNLIFLFDEKIYETTKASDIRKVYNDTVQNIANDGAMGEISPMMAKRSTEQGVVLPSSDMPTQQLVDQLLEKYDVLCIMGEQSGYYRREDLRRQNLGMWRGYFGQESVVTLPTSDDISEIIAAWLGAKYGMVTHQSIIRHLEPLVQGGNQTMQTIEKMITSTNFLPPVSGSLGSTPALQSQNSPMGGNGIQVSGDDAPFRFNR